MRQVRNIAPLKGRKLRNIFESKYFEKLPNSLGWKKRALALASARYS
jgi:hypothetical protein